MRFASPLLALAASAALVSVASAVSLAPGDILVSFIAPFETPKLIKVDPVTGAEEVITPDLGLLGGDVAVDPNGQVFVAGSRQVIRVDPATGAVTPVASDLAPGNVRDLLVDDDSLLVLTQSSTDTINRVDPVTGAVSVVARTFVGSCASNPVPFCNTPLQSVDLEGMAVEDDGNILLSVLPRQTGVRGVYRLDPGTGLVELVSTEAGLDNPFGISVSGSGEIALGHSNSPGGICGVPCKEILLVNPAGGFDLLSADGVLSTAFELQYEASGDLLVLHLAFSTPQGFVAERIIRIDPQGNQQILASDLLHGRGLAVVGPTPTPTVVPTPTPTTVPTPKKKVKKIKLKKAKVKKVKKTKKLKK